MRYALAASVLLLGAHPALAQTLEGAARTVTAFVAIKSACGKIMPIDQDKATKLATGIIHEGRRIYGKGAFDAAFAEDIERRRSEVEITGARQWCTKQRGYMKSIGAEDVFLN